MVIIIIIFIISVVVVITNITPLRFAFPTFLADPVPPPFFSQVYSQPQGTLGSFGVS